MPAKSKSQQRFFGMVRNCQKNGVCQNNKIKKVANSMLVKDAEKFASTKHKNLPEKVESFSSWFKKRCNEK